MEESTAEDMTTGAKVELRAVQAPVWRSTFDKMSRILKHDCEQRAQVMEALEKSKLTELSQAASKQLSHMIRTSVLIKVESGALTRKALGDAQSHIDKYFDCKGLHPEILKRMSSKKKKKKQDDVVSCASTTIDSTQTTSTGSSGGPSGSGSGGSAEKKMIKLKKEISEVVGAFFTV